MIGHDTPETFFHVHQLVVPLATDLGHGSAGVQMSKAALMIKVVSTVYSTAFELQNVVYLSIDTKKPNDIRNRFVLWNELAYSVHDGIPSGSEDVGVVATLVMRLKFLCKIIPGELVMHSETQSFRTENYNSVFT